MFDNKFILLANIVAVIHIALYSFSFATIYLSSRKNNKFLAYWFGLILIGTFPSQWPFRNDCPLRIFEYCLRYFGGEEISANKLHIVTYMVTKGIPEAKIYTQLLRQTGIFLLISFVFVTILAFFLDKKLRQRRAVA